MANKPLNTRIQSKIDTLERWESSTLPLLAGEIAIATVPATEENGLTDPVCIIKIGEDGVKTFNDLDLALHAKAIDVLPICKNSEELKNFIINTFQDSEIAQNLEILFNSLSVEDEPKENQYVSAVNQVQGKIVVSRETLPDFLQNISIVIEDYEGKKSIILKKPNGDIISYVAATDFIKDGMLDAATYNADTNILTLTWNLESGKSATEINLSDLVKTYTGDRGIEITEDGVIQLTEAIESILISSITELTSIGNSENDPSGLAITQTSANSYNITLDDSITFIFNCGGAEANI